METAETGENRAANCRKLSDIKRRYFDDFGRVFDGAPQFCRGAAAECRGGRICRAGVGACQSVRFWSISVVFVSED